MATTTNMSAMTRTPATWPAHKAKAKKRDRERKRIAREAQLKKDNERSNRP